MASLHHPHVVRVHGYGFDRALGPYFAMELLETTETILKAGRARPLADKVQLLAELLRAIGYLHRRGVIHRDLKPSRYSEPILSVGLDAAWSQITFSHERFVARGGVYTF